MAKNTKKTENKTFEDDVERVDLNLEVRGKNVTLSIIKDFDDFPFEAARLLEDQKYMTAFLLLLTPADQAKVQRLRLRSSDFTETILPAWNKAMGVEDDF